MLARRRPSRPCPSRHCPSRHWPNWRCPSRCRTSADPAGTEPTATNPASPASPDHRRPHPAGSDQGRQRPDGLCRPVWQVSWSGLSQVSRSTHRPQPAGRRARPLASQPTARRPGSGSRRPGNGRARCQLLFTSLPRPPRRPRTGIRNRYQQTSAGHACRYGCGARIAHWSDVVKRVRGHLPPGHNMNTRRVNDRSGGRRGAQN
jgi:hypothetical protein